MRAPVNLRPALRVLLIAVLALPLLLIVLGWVTDLMSALGDIATATVLGHLGTAVRVMWLADLVGLVVVLALDSLEHGREE